MKFGELWREGLTRSRAWLKEQRDRLGRVSESNDGRENRDVSPSLVEARPCLPDCAGAYARTSALAPEYRELFDDRPLSGGSPLFAGRDSAMTGLREAMTAWGASRTGTVALVGPDGAGRTTLLNQMTAELTAGETVTTVRLEQRVRTETDLIQTLLVALDMAETALSVEEMALLLRRAAPRIIVVDDAQRLMLRAPDAISTFEAFLSLVAATQEDCLWIVSFKEQAWRRLDYILGVRLCFGTVIELPYFTREEFMMVMAHRLAAAPVPFLFRPTGRSGPSEETSRDSDATDAEASSKPEPFLEHLFALSKGNMAGALFYWNAFSTPDASLKEVVLQAGQGIDFSLLKELDTASLFTLAELLGHGCLTAREHSEIFQQDERTSRLQLDALYRQRLLNRSALREGSLESMYRIERIFCAAVSTFLEAAHIIY